MNALLDTSVLIASGSGLPSEDMPPTAAISVLTLGELHAGVLLARTAPVRSHRKARLAAVRSAFSAIPFDQNVAEHYGEVIAFARRTSRSTKASDALIIATAAATGRTLVTLDTSQARLARATGVTVQGPDDTGP